MSQPISSADTSPATLPELCFTALRKHAKQDAVAHKREGVWLRVPSEVFIRRVRAVALGLAELGIRKGDRVALLSENRPEWVIADLAILSLGAVNVPLYTTQAPEQTRYILQNSGTRALFVANHKVFRRSRAAVEAVEGIERIIFFDKEEPADIGRSMTLEALEDLGTQRDKQDPHLYESFVNGVRGDDLATIIYTSGTTGEPKGVMLTHTNFVSNVLSVLSSFPISPADTALSVLPLSHIFERTVFYVFCTAGVSVYCVASLDQVGEYLREVRPTVMTAVPRFFEKVYHRILKQGLANKGLKRKLFAWSLRVGRRWAELKDQRQPVPPLLQLQQQIAARLVFPKWREGVGGRLRFFASGGAPLSPALAYAFLAAGILVLQGYGLTETCVVSINRQDDNRVGSVGVPFPGIEVRIAADGEIQMRGPNVMPGYFNNPEETKLVFTEDGWFKTGDIGRLDPSQGHLYITDRKKDLFKLSNGKYVAPQLIESLIKQSSLVSQVVVIGAGRKQPAALIVPDWEALANVMTERHVPLPLTRAAWSRDTAAVKIMQSEVAGLTAQLADYERVRRVALLPEEFSIDSGELTPTLKVKRRMVDEKYEQLINEIYGGPEAEA